MNRSKTQEAMGFDECPRPQQRREGWNIVPGGSSALEKVIPFPERGEKDSVGKFGGGKKAEGALTFSSKCPLILTHSRC